MSQTFPSNPHICVPRLLQQETSLCLVVMLEQKEVSSHRKSLSSFLRRTCISPD